MIQHILLMLVVPPLVLLVAPSLPFLTDFRNGSSAPRLAPSFAGRLRQPSANFSLILSSAGFSPPSRSLPGTFLPHSNSRFNPTRGTKSNIFVSSPLPTFSGGPSFNRFHPSRWSIPLYRFFGTFPGGALGAFRAFCDRVLYPSYTETPSPLAFSPLDDQIIAGSLMWVFGLLVLLLPAVFLTFDLLSPHLFQSSEEISRF